MREKIIKNENYIVIQGWMINELKLSGNELIIYALIYGFSQTEDHWFHGSLQYISDWTNISKNSCIANLKKLIDKKLIIKQEKEINGIKFCEYSTNLYTIQETCTPIQETCTPIQETCTPIQETCTNNIDNNIDNNINNINIINKQKSKKQKSKKQQNYIDIYNILDNFTTNIKVKEALKKYLKVRTTDRSLNVDQWNLILTNLRNECGTNSEYALELIEKATACGWMQIVYSTKFNGKPKSSYSSKSTFDNTAGHSQIYKISDEEFNKLTHEQKLIEMEKFSAIADMTKNQREFFNQYCLARDENGNLLKF